MTLGTCFGKFTKTLKFRLHITALDYIAQYAKYKVRYKVTCKFERKVTYKFEYRIMFKFEHKDIYNFTCQIRCAIKAWC